MKKTVCIFLAITAIVTAAFSQEIVKVGAFNYYPAIFKDSDGEIKGFYVDALNELGKKENIQFIYVFGSWDEGLVRLNSGEVDMLTSVAVTEERQKYMDYTTTPVLTVWSEVYVGPDSHVKGILDLNEKKIAVMKSDFNGSSFRQLTNKLGIECKFVETTDFDQVFKLISNGKVDAGIVNNVFGVPKSHEYGILSSGIVFNPFDIFFTVKKDSNTELLSLLDSYLHNWKHDANSVLNTSQKKWAYKNVGVIEVLPNWVQRAIYLALGLVVVLIVFLGFLRYKAIIATEKAEEGELLFKKLFEDSADAILLMDKKGVFAECNQTALNLLLMPREQLLFLSLVSISPEYQPGRRKSEEAAIEMIELALEKGLHRFDWTCVNAKGGEFIVDVSLMPVVLKGRTMLHATWRDITEKKKAEEYQKLLQVAKKTAQFKQNFLANMSHEIRTPLTGVLGMIDILEQTSLTEEQRDFLETLKTSGENLREIINQVLDYSKIEAGKLTIHPTVFEFKSLPENAGYLFKNNLNHGVELKNHIDPTIPAFIEADKFRLSQVLNNLVSNAVKFTSQGSITIQSSLISTDNDKRKVVIKVEIADTGIGIPEDLQTRLFVPFSQVEVMDTRHYEGTGLGLSICLQLVEMMGGQIGLTSEAGKGSTFWFTFPALIAQSTETEKTEKSESTLNKSFRVLLVEDKAVNQKVITLMLTAMGHDVKIVSNGQQALEHFEPGKFDFILMDIQMPVMDGITATQKLKQIHKNLPPVVGLSANAFEGDREKYMTLGMDDYITKPMKRQDFKELMERIILLSAKDCAE